MNNDLVSIVMATYNGEKYLRPQLDSIREQTYQNIELIVVDDGSTDNTLSILNEYAALDSRIHVFPAEKNLGVALNFERGLKLAKGSFIALADQDDIFRKDKIELLFQALKSQPDRDLVLSDLSVIDKNGKEISASMWHYQKLNPKQGKPFRRLVYDNFATGCAMMFRRRLLDSVLPFPPGCFAHDWWIAVVSASSKAGGICLIDKQLTDYRQHGLNVCGAQENKAHKIDFIITRIKAAPRGNSILNKRVNLYNLNLNRLSGYLQSPIWSSKDRIMIKQTISLFSDYIHDGQSSLTIRIAKLPQRLRYAFITGRFASCLLVVMHTLLPYK